MTEISTTGRGIEQLNSLLRGEISAAETYAMAIEKIGGDRPREAALLRAISQEHGEAAQHLREAIRRSGGEAEDASGAWGAYAKTIEGVATLFGDASALKALKEGEEHGLKDYQDTLEDEDLPADCQAVIRGLLVKQREHIVTLDRLLANV